MYILNADPYAALPKGKWENKHYFHVSGSLCGLHVLADSIHNPQSVTFVDIEDDQYRWTIRVAELIKDSPTFTNFIQRMLCRSHFYGDVDREIDSVLKDHEWAELLHAARWVGRRANRCYDPRPLQVLQLPIKRQFWHWPEGEKKGAGDWFYHWIGIAPDAEYVPPFINCIYPGHGFHSKEGYAKVRNILKSIPVQHLHGDVFNIEYPTDTLLYLSGISRNRECNELSVEWIDCPIWYNDHCYNDERSAMYVLRKQDGTLSSSQGASHSCS